jgi:hypothetical protein
MLHSSTTTPRPHAIHTLRAPPSAPRRNSPSLSPSSSLAPLRLDGELRLGGWGCDGGRVVNKREKMRKQLSRHFILCIHLAALRRPPRPALPRVTPAPRPLPSSCIRGPHLRAAPRRGAPSLSLSGAGGGLPSSWYVAVYRQMGTPKYRARTAGSPNTKEVGVASHPC